MNNNMKNNRKEYQKQYYLDNIDKIKQYKKDNKEKIKIQKAFYYQTNKEKISERERKYDKTDKGLKVNALSRWKQRGLISEDYNKIYERYILTEECDNCGILLDEEGDYNTKKCMDHSHTTGEFRNILCNLCNVNRKD
tara:strand:- start:191 stop:604 length:414 start_codon:yes stop_codon:yes gene_type:complete